jgi:hypothetical protein
MIHPAAKRVTTCHFTTSLGPDTTIRIREIDAASAIS